MTVVCLQLMVDNPSAQRWILLPDASGTFLVAAAAPLFVDSNGTVSLLQTSIVAVGDLTAGSLTRSFGETHQQLVTVTCCLLMLAYLLAGCLPCLLLAASQPVAGPRARLA